MEKVVIFQAEDGKPQIDVQIENETVWLSLLQMSVLFERDKSVISRHLKNIFRDNELTRNEVVANFATTGTDGKTYQVDYFNLDAILSVGYRVNSKRGTQFRKWASQKLKEYIIQGYSLNQKRITEDRIEEITKVLNLLSKTLKNPNLTNETETEILSLVASYAKTWTILSQYDENHLQIPKSCIPAKFPLGYMEALKLIGDLKKQLSQQGEATNLFGQQRGDQLADILGNIEQTFDESPLYSSREEKAAHLLYFIIKDHPFIDGNKRIGALLFLYYLKKQGSLLASLSDSALIALSLLVAESDPSSKDIIVKLITNLIAP